MFVFFGHFYFRKAQSPLRTHPYLNTPVIEIDNIQLKYTDFYSLLYDVRSLGHSNMYVDRKINFDKKKYFKKVEEIYWKKFSKCRIVVKMSIIAT